MPSETDLVNAALRLVAGNRVTSMAAGDKNANVASDLYQIVRDDMLASHNWNFATKRIELARSATIPAYQFSYAYVAPSDWIKTVSVHDNDGGFGTLEYKEENVDDQRCILASSEQLFLRYIAKVVDPNLMPADFRMTLVFTLGSRLAQSVANSGSAVDRLEVMAGRKLLAAKFSDASGSTPERRPVGSWVARRFGLRDR